MTHEEMQILISAYMDGEVTAEEKIVVEDHLKTCTFCQKEYKAYGAISSSLSKWPDEKLSPDEKIQLQKQLEKGSKPAYRTSSMMAVATMLAVAIMVGSVVELHVNKQEQSSLRQASQTKVAAIAASPVSFAMQKKEIPTAESFNGAPQVEALKTTASDAYLSAPAAMPMMASARAVMVALAVSPSASNSSLQQYYRCPEDADTFSLGDTITSAACLQACKANGPLAGCWWQDGTSGLPRACHVCRTMAPQKTGQSADWAASQ